MTEIKDKAALPDEGLGQYIRELRQYPRLTPEEERALAMRCAQGDQEAISQMVNSNLALVVSVAREYMGRGVPLQDLIQEGNIGLIVAAKKFDYRLEYRFSTYATKWIRQGITRCLLNHAGLIRVPGYTSEKIRKLLAARARLQQETGKDPDLDTLAQAVDMSPQRVEQLLGLIPEVCSLDAPAGDEAGSSLGQLLPDQGQQPLDILAEAQLLETLDSLMSRLSQRQQYVVRSHYGMDDGVCRSLEEIAGTLGVSKERVRQIEKQAFDKIRKWGAELGLEEYLD